MIDTTAMTVLVLWRCTPWYDEGEDWPEAYGPEQWIYAPDDPDAALKAVHDRDQRMDPGHNVTGWHCYRADDPAKPWEAL